MSPRPAPLADTPDDGTDLSVLRLVAEMREIRTAVAEERR